MTDEDREQCELAAADVEHALDSLTDVKGVKRIVATLVRVREQLDEKARQRSTEER